MDGDWEEVSFTPYLFDFRGSSGAHVEALVGQQLDVLDNDNRFTEI